MLSKNQYIIKIVYYLQALSIVKRDLFYKPDSWALLKAIANYKGLEIYISFLIKIVLLSYVPVSPLEVYTIDVQDFSHFNS